MYKVSVGNFYVTKNSYEQGEKLNQIMNRTRKGHREKFHFYFGRADSLLTKMFDRKYFACYNRVKCIETFYSGLGFNRILTLNERVRQQGQQ